METNCPITDYCCPNLGHSHMNLAEQRGQAEVGDFPSHLFPMCRRSSWGSGWSTYQSVFVLGWGARKVTGQATLGPVKVSARPQNCLWPQRKLRLRLKGNDYQALTKTWEPRSGPSDDCPARQTHPGGPSSRKPENAEGIITKTQILLYLFETIL